MHACQRYVLATNCIPYTAAFPIPSIFLTWLFKRCTQFKKKILHRIFWQTQQGEHLIEAIGLERTRGNCGNSGLRGCSTEWGKINREIVPRIFGTRYLLKWKEQKTKVLLAMRQKILQDKWRVTNWAHQTFTEHRQFQKDLNIQKCLRDTIISHSI
ncbi:hypothetical protein HOLleu_06906 [Holothuria leucospilota]|uniref:Uncharacterized protein n=1 Tax=Holothuria leucospilota TaxID=206669 RepID=A0A9Q1HJA5_HOLLE|nr:hypothetical protein HOLleu_06906 [Holothuria leucospilota]